MVLEAVTLRLRSARSKRLPITEGTAASGNVVPLRSAGSTNIAVVVVEGSNPSPMERYMLLE